MPDGTHMQTMPELAGSVSIDAGSNALALDASGNPLATDQRGLLRVFDSTVDIGACEYQPTVAAVSPAQGSPGGGTAVTISGDDLAGATAVDFGSKPATGVAYNSTTQQLAATSPAGTGRVDVTVVTPSGTSQANPPADQFSYSSTPVLNVGTTSLTLPTTTEGTAGAQQLHGQWQRAGQQRHCDFVGSHRKRNLAEQHVRFRQPSCSYPTRAAAFPAPRCTLGSVRRLRRTSAAMLTITDAIHSSLDKSIAVSGTVQQVVTPVLNVSTTSSRCPPPPRARPAAATASRSVAVGWAAAMP